MRILPTAALLVTLAACSGGGGGTSNEANVSNDPFGATGAPGADMTDNGATDGSNDLNAVDGNGQ